MGPTFSWKSDYSGTQGYYKNSTVSVIIGCLFPVLELLSYPVFVVTNIASVFACAFICVLLSTGFSSLTALLQYEYWDF